MIPAYVVEIFDFVNPYDPVLACVSFFECAELGSFCWEPRTPNSILCLSRWEEGVEIVVGHFVPIRAFV